jgi:segregation and condensation protein B
MESKQDNMPDGSDQTEASEQSAQPTQAAPTSEASSNPQSVDDSYIPTQHADEQESAQAAADAQPTESPAQDEGASSNPQSEIRNPQSTAAAVEAILFATDSPLTLARVAQVAQVPQREVKAAIATLNERYKEASCAFAIEEIAGGFQMLTLPEFHDVLSRLLKARNDSKLSQSAMETLSIVAYRQPILRADIESIRGVASGEMLRGLMERQLVKIVGRAEVVGRPMLYGTTKRFLEVFGLASLEDLPNAEELRAPTKQPTTPAPNTPATTDAPTAPAATAATSVQIPTDAPPATDNPAPGPLTDPPQE